jgi:hypothetical protein
VGFIFVIKSLLVSGSGNHAWAPYDRAGKCSDLVISNGSCALMDATGNPVQMLHSTHGRQHNSILYPGVLDVTASKYTDAAFQQLSRIHIRYYEHILRTVDTGTTITCCPIAELHRQGIGAEASDMLHSLKKRYIECINSIHMV